jgi:predicted O-methyltransferase YrrM
MAEDGKKGGPPVYVPPGKKRVVSLAHITRKDDDLQPSDRKRRPENSLASIEHKITIDKKRRREESIWTRDDLMPNDQIKKVFNSSQVEDENGEYRKFTSGVDPREGFHLYTCVKDACATGTGRTLEVGLANGMSAMYICQALSAIGSGSHVAIDPNQSTQWSNIGRLNISRAGLADFLTVMEEPSFSALPRLLDSVDFDGKFDFVFIDGMHLFDYTLIDVFFAEKLLKVGGTLCLDDIRHPGVQKCFAYINSNYKHLKLQITTPCSKTMATFVKLKEDERRWDFHKRF